jgi:hypothetical protein
MRFLGLIYADAEGAAQNPSDAKNDKTDLSRHS